MKDIIITGVRVKKELVALLVCFLIGFVANIGAIIYYKTALTEIVTSIGYVIVSAFVLYFIWSLIRVIISLLLNLFRRFSRSK
ncbi:hypothetical protein SDC9_170348 [bioreactor metagenome]|uniref:Uncharacterized protein n=1 Tax=bioreactor metagenome TaxID=1076179 RepID=A0A645GGU9_9ZZZZ|nr:hypothetical protein [Paludibacter sp.]